MGKQDSSNDFHNQMQSLRAKRASHLVEKPNNNNRVLDFINSEALGDRALLK